MHRLGIRSLATTQKHILAKPLTCQQMTKICCGQVDVGVERRVDFLFTAVLFECAYVLHLLLGIRVIERNPFFKSAFFACLTRKIVFIFPLETLNVVLKLHLFLIKDLNVKPQ